MVLTQRWGAVLFLLVASTGCLQRSTPPVQAPNGTVVAVAYVRDDVQKRGVVADVPAGLKQRVAEALSKRNLQVQEVPYEQYAAEFARVSESQRRFSVLMAQAPQAPLYLLVETRVSYFSQVGGRFSWEVYVRTTGGRAGSELEPTSVNRDYGAALQFDHQRQDDAQLEVSRQIASQAAGLFDSFLASPLSTTPTTSTHGGPTFAPGLGAPAQGGMAPAGDTGGGASPATDGGTSSWVPPDGDVIYFVMVDRFANGDPGNDGKVDLKDAQAFHGGDLQGVIDRLDGLRQLGVRTVWLSPVFQMRTEKFYGYGAFHGYWVEDFGKVEPRFGDEALLKRLADELRRRDMRLVLDVVLNHVGPETRLVREKPQWFHGLGPIDNWDDPRELVMKDVHGLPDLAVEKEEVYAHLLEHSRRWVDAIRPAGYRLDAVKHLPMDFWARYNDDVRAHAGRDFLMLGEMLDGDPVLLSRTQEEGRFGTMFDFPLGFALVDVFCRGRSPSHLGAVLFNDRLYPAPGSLVTLVDNHDLPRVMSECGGDAERVKRALAVQLTARGVPSLTYGTEEGLAGKKEPENRGDMRFTPDHPLRVWITRLLELRRGSEALQRGETVVLAAREDLFAYARVTPDEAVVIAVNRGKAPVDVDLPLGLGEASLSEMLTGFEFPGATGPGVLRSIISHPGQVSLLRLKPREAGGFGELVKQAHTRWRGQGERRTVELAVDKPVRLVGSGPELGGWKPERSPRAGPGGFKLSLPVGGVFEYKLVRESTPGKFDWEGGDNRLLFIPEGSEPLRLKLAWGKR